MVILLLLVFAIILLLIPISYRFPRTALKTLNFLYFFLNLGAFVLALATITGDIVFLHIVVNVVKEDLKIRSLHVPRFMLENYLLYIFLIYIVSIGIFYAVFRLMNKNRAKRYPLLAK